MRKITFFVYSMAGGGAEKTVLHLTNRYVSEGISVELILIKNKGEYLTLLDDRIKIIVLNKIFLKFGTIGKILAGLLAIRRSYRETLLCVGEWPNLIGPIASKVIPISNVFLREGNTKTFINCPQKYNLGKFIQWLSQKSYTSSNVKKIICISKAVENHLHDVFPSVRSKTIVIHNAINIDEIRKNKNKNVDHPWLKKRDTPVIIAAGRLTDQKDYPTMLNSLVEVLKKRQVKLIIMGTGTLEVELKELVNKMGINKEVDFIGFQNNPYKFFEKSDLFVHSAKYEGFGNVFIESIACGIPIVTTDCDSPREIILNDDHGKIVPVGDYNKLAEAVIDTLSKAKNLEALENRAKDFSIKKISKKYLNCLKN